MPLTLQPSKPRLCNDNSYLNLWMIDQPFNLDHLHQLPRYVNKNSYQTVCDDKSGYDRILLVSFSRTYFGFQWGGWFFTTNTIPFGWKLFTFVYHSTGLLVSYYSRSISISCSLYIDKRHISQDSFTAWFQFFPWTRWTKPHQFPHCFFYSPLHIGQTTLLYWPPKIHLAAISISSFPWF